jgi:hypothetical protein
MSVIGVYDGGDAKIKDKSGQTIHVGVVLLRTVTNESQPVDHVGYCRFHYKESVIKNLRRIIWQKSHDKEVVPEEKPQG